MAKALTTEVKRLSIDEVRDLPEGAQKMLSWTCGGRHSGTVTVTMHEAVLWLAYTPADSATWGQWVNLDWVPCPFGGARPWFVCACERRCGTLFLGRRGFTCRSCAELNYQSTREPARHGDITRANKIRARLDWVPGIAFGHGPKPRGMHWATFNRLVAEHDRCVGAWVGAIEALPMLRGVRMDLGKARPT